MKQDLTALLLAIENLKKEHEEMPWIETVTVAAPSFEIEDPEDDLNRETLFYNLTLQSGNQDFHHYYPIAI